MTGIAGSSRIGGAILVKSPPEIPDRSNTPAKSLPDNLLKAYGTPPVGTDGRVGNLIPP